MSESADYIEIAASGEETPALLSMPDELAGLRVDQALAKLLPQHSRSRLQEWLRGGQIRIDGLSPALSMKVRGGERVEIDVLVAPEAAAELPQDIPLQVLFEDEHLLVVDKPAGLVVHPGSGNWEGTLLNALLHHVPQAAELPRAGIVHRLDKDTSGLLVVAKTAFAQEKLIDQLKARTARRHYWALVHGVPARNGCVDVPIGRHPRRRTQMAVVRDGRPALTRYRVSERFQAASLLECELESGRTHQIRVHLAHIGHPLLGDPVYGRRQSPAWAAFTRQALHAYLLGLEHPATGEWLQWTLPLPADFVELLQRLRAQSARGERQ